MPRDAVGTAAVERLVKGGACSLRRSSNSAHSCAGKGTTPRWITGGRKLRVSFGGVVMTHVTGPTSGRKLLHFFPGTSTSVRFRIVV